MKSKRGYWLYTFSWLPDVAQFPQPKALIFLVHGLGEHCTRKGYWNLANYFTARGYAVFSLDHQGHGRSSGDRAFVRSFQWAVNDFYDYAQTITIKYPRSPRILLGHSMGGGLALCMKLSHSTFYDSVVIFGAASNMHVYPKFVPGTRTVLNVVGNLAPKSRLVFLSLSKISRNPQAIVDYANDPLVNHGGIPTRTICVLSEMGIFIESQWSAITFPIFVIHGEADGLVEKEQSIRLFDNIPSQDKKLWIIKDMYHEVFEDPDKDAVFSEVMSWIDQHLSTANKNYRA
jgi:alpha-beta hydrolase superfamily lysophospholipase